jgi:hypothetical protein
MKPNKFFYKLLDILTVLCLLIFFASFGFKDSKSSGWYQQWFPNMNGSTITSLTFLDSLIGYATTSKNPSNQTYILKTTNGGDNWFILNTYVPSGVNTCFSKVQFVNYSTGFVSTNDAGDFFKTTNAGINWIDYPVPVVAYDFSVINSDTLLHVNNTGFGPGVYRSINGGLNWQGIPGISVSRIYMFNKDIGFSLGTNMWKTTNGGVNWFTITGETYSSIQLVDSLTGWKAYAGIKKTTDGGLNWISQQLPNLSHSWWASYNFAFNRDTVWLGGDSPYPYIHNPLYKTTNGGLNWGYQIPDSNNIDTLIYRYIQFIDRNIGWAYDGYWNSGIHTKKGGNDTTFYTNIKEQTTNIAEKYKLFQNYPNPFNPSTNIKYQITNSKYIAIIIYDINGKEIMTLINKKQNAGTYEIEFTASNLTSGVYFYTLFVDGNRVDTKKAILIK